MPDRSDVEEALAGAIAGVLYPDGPEAPPAVANGRVYRGWPVPRVLESELAQGVLHVTVQPVAGSTRDRSRYPDDWQGTTSVPGLVAAVSGDRVQFGGTGGAGTVVGVRVDGRAYAYRMRNGDTGSLVAAALAALVRVDRPAVAVGDDLIVLDAQGLLARVVTDGVGGREVRRQSAGFRVTFWCPDPATRDNAVALVDAALADTPFLDVSGWACRLELSSDSSTDERSAGGIWRRDLVYSIEYPTTTSEILPAMLFGLTDVNGVPFVG